MIDRYFTLEEYEKLDYVGKSKFNPYDLFEWKKVNVEIKDYATGDFIYSGYDLEFPTHYSQQACDIIASKYFFRNIDGKGTPEKSLKQVIHRMVMFWTEALIDEGLLEGEWTEGCYRDMPSNCYIKDAQIFYDECVYTLLKQMWAPNSPQWFNTGIELMYGIKGESDDMYYYDEQGIHKSPDRYTRSQTSACFIIPITDHLLGENSITDHFVTETKLFKGGSGVGTNFSPLRAEGEKLSSGGKSSGLMSFLLGLDRNAGAIKSGGTTRRAAKMVIVDVDHPDIYEFINWKSHEEKKARDLISLGYDGSLNGEAYQTVSGQNSNNSVRVNKEFMEKILGIDNDPTFKLKGRKDSDLDRVVNVHDVWDAIAQSAWECGDPAIQFDDKYNEWHTAPNAGRINATNPCSEYAFIDNSACNLASINLLSLYDGTEFDYLGYENLIHLCQLVLEASIHWGQFPTPEVAENTYKYRATGLGFCNLASLLLSKGIAYDSYEGRRFAKVLAAILTARSFLTSTEIAKKVGECDGFYENKDPFIKVLTKFRDDSLILNNYPGIYCMFDEALGNCLKYGVRNMQVTVLAPTGTISLAMDCAATGIEPFFSHKMYKKCSDGSLMEMTNPLAADFVHDCCSTFDNKLIINDYQNVVDYFNEHGTYQECFELAEEDQKVLETANEISPEAHVAMMAALQEFITGSISKTVNLPNDATVEDIKDIYEFAYTKGCKSISVYRDGSKNAQPLNTEIEEEDTINLDPIESEVRKTVNELKETDEFLTNLDDPEEELSELETILEDPDNIGARFKEDKWEPIREEEQEAILNEIHTGDKCLPVNEEVYAEFVDTDKHDTSLYENPVITNLLNKMDEYIKENNIEEIREELEKDLDGITEDIKNILINNSFILDYNTTTIVESDNPQLFSSGIEDGQIILVTREGDDVFIQSNKSVFPVVEDDPFYSKENQEALKESLKQSESILPKEKELVEESNLYAVMIDEAESDPNKRVKYMPIESSGLDDRYVHVAVPEEIVTPKLKRKKPDGIRLGVTHTAKIGNVELYVTVSYYDDGGLCEVFVSSDKEGTTIKGLLSSLSKAISHMLQYGVKPEDIASMLRNQQYEPQGHVTRHPYIKMCTSISDFIARVIEYETYDFSRCQIKPEIDDDDRYLYYEPINSEKFMEIGQQMIDGFAAGLGLDDSKEEKDNELQDDLNYTGSECSVCHSTRMVQNGTCELCLDCGNTSGCS